MDDHRLHRRAVAARRRRPARATAPGRGTRTRRGAGRGTGRDPCLRPCAPRPQAWQRDPGGRRAADHRLRHRPRGGRDDRAHHAGNGAWHDRVRVPEQIRGESAGPASDVFSLGGVLAFAATGIPPFGGDSAAAVMFRIVSQPPDLTGIADRQLARLIQASLAKVAADRPVVADLLAAVSGAGRAGSISGLTAGTGTGGGGTGGGGATYDGATAGGDGMATRTSGPAVEETGPGRSVLLPPPAGGATADRVARSRHSRGRPRRGAAALVTALAVAAALAVTLTFLLTKGTPPGGGWSPHGHGSERRPGGHGIRPRQPEQEPQPEPEPGRHPWQPGEGTNGQRRARGGTGRSAGRATDRLQLDGVVRV